MRVGQVNASWLILHGQLSIADHWYVLCCQGEVTSLCLQQEAHAGLLVLCLEHQFAECTQSSLIIIHVNTGQSQMLLYGAPLTHEIVNVTFLPGDQSAL